MGLILNLFAFLCLQSQAAEINEAPLSASVVNFQENFIKIKITMADGYHAFEDMFRLSFQSPSELSIMEFKVSPTYDFVDPSTKRSRKAIDKTAELTGMYSMSSKNITATEAVLELGYQACSDKICLFPKKLRLTVPLETKTLVAMPKLSFSEQVFAIFNEALNQKNHFWLFLMVFVAGFLTSLTPCVFPMIPITMSIIGARSTKNRRSRSILLSVFYVLGIAVTYSLLGVLAAKTGAIFGAFLGNVWAASFIAIIFFVMGLSMLGLFEIQVPKFLRDFAGKSEIQSGFSGAFLTGIFAGVIASPCVGPVLAAVLTYVAKTGDVTLGFSLLFTFACGLGIIFIVLGAFSGFLTRLPRSGAWMQKIKYIFAATFFALGVYYIYPVLGFKAQSTQIAKRQLRWQTYRAEALKKINKPVIIDFSAEWCVACHELDKYTFTAEPVLAFESQFTLLRFDATKDTEAVRAILQKYDVRGLPTVLFLGRNGQVLQDLTVTGFIDGDKFSEKMKAALEAF